MDPMFYVIAIMGCGDGSTACAQTRIEPAHYQSVTACHMAMPAALARNTDIDYPVVTAACRATGERMVQDKRAQANRG